MVHTSLCVLSPVTTMMQATSPLGLLPTQTNHIAILLKSHSKRCDCTVNLVHNIMLNKWWGGGWGVWLKLEKFEYMYPEKPNIRKSISADSQ